MEIQLSRRKMLFFLIALFLSNLAVMADLVIVPITGYLYGNYDNVNAVNFYVTGPALVCVFASLITGKLMQYFSKKTLLVSALCLLAIGGGFGGISTNLTFIIAMRVLVGMSTGITNTVNMSLIAEIFVDEKKRSKIMGFYNSTLSVIGAIVTAGAGVMAAASGWQSVFKIYWLAVPILVLVILFVPRTPAEGKISPEEASEEVATGNKNWVLIFAALVFGFLVYNIGYATLVYQVGVIVAEGGLGDESFAGTLSSLATITGFVTNFGFGFYYARTKRGTPIIGYALIVIGFCLFYFFGSRMSAAIGMIAVGLSYGVMFSYHYLRTTLVVPPSRISFCMGVVTATWGTGIFLSSYLVTFLKSILGSGTLVGTLPVLTVIFGIACILEVVQTIQNKKNPTEYAVAVSTFAVDAHAVDEPL